jgi:hypothetical protein
MHTPTSRMTDEQIEQQLAVLGFHRRWFALGVLTESWLKRVEQREELPERVLGLALSEYLTKRRCLDDDILGELLDLATRADHRCAQILAGWEGMTVAQLDRMIHHEATAPEVRDSAAQWQEVRMFEHPDERNDSDLVGFIEGSGGTGTGSPASAGVFKVDSFRFGIAWRRRLAMDERRRIAAWLAAPPPGHGDAMSYSRVRSEYRVRHTRRARDEYLLQV